MQYKDDKHDFASPGASPLDVASNDMSWIMKRHVAFDEPWPEPMPILMPLSPRPYPVATLPGVLRDAVVEVQAFTQAPLGMVATSALSAAAIAAQAYYDVQRANMLSGPVSVFSITLAASGERKSTCDKLFKQPLQDYELEQIERAKAEVAAFKADHSAWEQERMGLLDKIRQDTKRGNNTENTKRALELHQMKEPKPPLVPKLLYSDITPEKLAYNLSRIWPSAGILSSEAGAVLGSHAMNSESLMRTLASFNELWDAAPLSFERKSTDSCTVTGARLSVALQVQPAALQQFNEKSGSLARGIGFFARFLVAYPESTQGRRFFREAPESWPALDKYHARIRDILSRWPVMDENGSLRPTLLTLSTAAKKVWIAEHDAVETELREGGSLESIRDVASKIADNAARIAAIFHVLQGKEGPIEAEDMRSAWDVASWHLHEALRIFQMVPASEVEQNAYRLDRWLVEHCRCSVEPITTTPILQKGPKPTRIRSKMLAALNRLEELGRIRCIRDPGRSMYIYVNPALLDQERRRSWPSEK